MRIIVGVALVATFSFSCKLKVAETKIDNREGLWENDFANQDCNDALRAGETESFNAPGRTKKFAMNYLLRHCPAATNPLNIEDVLNKTNFVNPTVASNFLRTNGRDFGPFQAFSWWAKPDIGFYCLTNRKAVVQTHARQLRDMGIDFVVLDISNWSNVQTAEAVVSIIRPLNVLLEEWSKIEGAPKVVPWVPFQPYFGGPPEPANLPKPMVDYVTELMNESYPQMRYMHRGKPMLGRVVNFDGYSNLERQRQFVRKYSSSWTIFNMWGFRDVTGTNEWSFLMPCADRVNYVNSFGFQACNQPSNSQMVPVALAYVGSNLERQKIGGAPKFFGRTLVNQFETVHKNGTAPFVMISSWNEWIGQRLQATDSLSNGTTEYIDTFDFERNRDIEPGGRFGDYYYYLLTDLIQSYKRGERFSIGQFYLTRDSLFNRGFYAFKNPQVVQQVGNSYAALKSHWLSTGIRQGLSASPAFDPAAYKRRNPDLRSLSNPQLLNHFLREGFQMGRIGSDRFHAETYLKHNGDLRAAFGRKYYFAALKHYEREGYLQNRRARP